ncbi:hypothetical protein Cylst_2517 [Cylindrospermum stagnale PCC 7417]|uniref:1,4-dihydroxy-6-naphthoate synthase n=2 Tax=Cylindrospermum stagnale PCC 7417 TaxID=56107 RepID=K9WY45_9NOST|nr:hypothetical protein [Cylindrospermum stagnale]AFZ24726.1 hypothetical protein Cylst_2517 [Cylindrospermum stagnale PCC 7417]
MSDDLACMIYADINENELAEKLRRLLSQKNYNASFFLDDNEILVIKNLSFDSIQRQQFPDGFLYFQQIIEIFPDETKTVSLENQIALVSRILQYLWSEGVPAVAACDYENKLPNNGGYKNTVIPWVNSERTKAHKYQD